MRLLGLTTICALAFVMPTVAHHSHGNYTDGTIDIEGVVKEVVLVVPHSYVYIDVKKGDATLEDAKEDAKSVVSARSAKSPS